MMMTEDDHRQLTIADLTQRQFFGRERRVTVLESLQGDEKECVWMSWLIGFGTETDAFSQARIEQFARDCEQQ